VVNNYFSCCSDGDLGHGLAVPGRLTPMPDFLYAEPHLVLPEPDISSTIRIMALSSGDAKTIVGG
jgi:hypothetical protein